MSLKLRQSILVQAQVVQTPCSSYRLRMRTRLVFFISSSLLLACAQTRGIDSGNKAEPKLKGSDLQPMGTQCHMPVLEDNGPSDQPGACRVTSGEAKQSGSFTESVQRWTSIQELNNWIGHNFIYDKERMARFGQNVSASEKGQVYSPEELFNGRSGVCFDLSRFSYEALTQMPLAEKIESLKYVKIKFEPIEINGAKIRMHWLIAYQFAGKFYFTADSRCPGRLYGPYDSVEKFQECYAAFRGRKIESLELVDTYKKRLAKKKLKTSRTH